MSITQSLGKRAFSDSPLGTRIGEKMAYKYSKKEKCLLFAGFLTLLIFPGRLYAGGGNSGEISWIFLIIGLLGGLAFFLYGMEKMSEGMKKAAGKKMRSILSALTKNRVMALFVGGFVTMVIQSSSATTVMLVGFVQAGLMSFVQSLGVILGADIGTTVTAQLIAFKLTDYALLMIAVGFGLRLFTKREDLNHIGEVILGCGILFYGMKLMNDAMAPLRTYPVFFDMMKGLENPLLGLLVGTLFTALVQSSSASIGIVIVLGQQGLITLDAGIPLIFGANIGTCLTAALACIGTSREAKRVALAHVLFKIAGVLLFVFWIPDFADFIRGIADRFGSDTARQIANAHTIFNVSLGLILLPFTTFFAKLVVTILPDKEVETGLIPAAWHLDWKRTSTPGLAINLARAETSRMAKLLGRMLRAIIIPFVSDEKLIDKEAFSKSEFNLLLQEIPKKDEIFSQLSLLEGIEMREKKIDYLNENIGHYLIQIARQGLSEEQANEVYGMISIIKDMENIGDIIHNNMLRLIKKKRLLGIDFSDEGKEELMIYHNKACKQIDRLREAFKEVNMEKAEKIMEKEPIYLDLESQYRIRHLERMLQERKESVKTHEVHMELMDLMKQVTVYAANIAKTFLNSSRKR